MYVVAELEKKADSVWQKAHMARRALGVNATAAQRREAERLAEEAANEMSSALQEAVADLVPEVQAALQLEVEKALHAEVDKAVLAQQYEAPSQSPVEV